MNADLETESAGELLVVEDTPASLKLLSDLLGSAGYIVRQAPDGELALWSAQSRPPELVLLDVRMPGIDGLEVCRRLKASPELRDIPVIFLSAQYDTDDKVRGFEVGAVDFIGKPYQPEEVLARTAAHVKLARTQRALAAANEELTTTLAQLRTARDEILRSERLAALGAMVTGVAHELNTPLGNSMMAASTLAARTADFLSQVGQGMRKSELENYARDVAQASDLLMRNLDKSAGLVTSFKQVAIDQSSAMRRRFDLAHVAEDIAVTLQPSFKGSGVRLAVQVPDEVAMDTFPGPLCQVFSQLVLNALQHGFEGRKIGHINVSGDPADADGIVRLRFEDDGSGIEPSNLPKVFDPFFTTKLGQGSGGLGLHIVHNIVTNVLCGSITVESRPGATCFTVSIPSNAPDR